MYIQPLMILSLWRHVLASKPYSKRQQEIWRVECELGIIADPECPVDGSWSAWSPWSPCRGACDGVGHRTRTRECNNPPPAKDGTPCTGSDEEKTPCHLTNCTVQDYKKLTQGDSARQEAFAQLETVPSLMEHCLQRDCPFEAIEAALYNENTWQLHPEALWNALLCVKYNMGCPVTGGWGSWGVWSKCGARCGPGVRWRLRRCDRPPPSDARRLCVGNPLEAQDCEGDQCAIEDQVDYDVGGSWGEWQQWTACSENCGPGARRRRRVCNEKSTRQVSGTWGTHCQGQHDELQACQNMKCVLEGSWSGWSVWGPCSRSCGAGLRARARSCTRPVPAGGGAPCLGPKREVGPCHQAPCEVYSHTVAVFNGDSHMNYNFENKRSTLFHFYIRFMPLSPHGTLVRRGSACNQNIRLSLQKWHVCLDVKGTSTSCALPRICTPSVLEPATWHSALVTVTNDAATLRLDDARVALRGTFPCEPELEDDKMNIFIGEKFHSEIQEVVLNFMPLVLTIDRSRRNGKSNFYPTSVSNIAYEKASMEEAFLNLDADQYLRLPCFNDPYEWQIELTLKPKRDSGTILFLYDEGEDSWLHLSLENMRVKLQVQVKELRSENCGATEYFPDQWLYVVLLKKRYSNCVETHINAGDRIHAVLEKSDIKHMNNANITLNSLTQGSSSQNQVNKNGTKLNSGIVPFPICSDEFFVGGVHQNFRDNANDATTFSGIIAAIFINGELLDLHKFNIERYRGDEMQLSSRTASVSGAYHETSWGSSNTLNLTCLHARTARSPHSAQWLFLDTGINNMVHNKARCVDDGRILRLVASATNDLRGFYTCRSHAQKITRNIITYGVIGKIRQRLTSPDTTTAIALVTTLVLIIGTLSWIVAEGINDLRTGYGFFRERHLTPQEEADAVCDYIDQNIDLIGSKSAARLAKARARRKAQLLTSQLNFAAQEPQGMMFEPSGSSESTVSEPDTLPHLPAIKSSSLEQTQNIYRCEPFNISSPRHGSNISPRPKLTSSSAEASPRVLCSRLLMGKRLPSAERKRRLILRSKNRISTLLANKSSSCVNRSHTHKILQKFQDLKSDDS